MASNADTVAAVFPHAALAAAATLLKAEENTFGEHHLAFQRRLDGLNQVFREVKRSEPPPLVLAEELAAADLIALGKALPTSGNKPAVLAHAIKTIAALSTVAEISGRVANLTKDIGKQIGGGETDRADTFTADAAGGMVIKQAPPTFLEVSHFYETPAHAREKGAPEHHIQEWCRKSNTPYIAPTEGDNKRPKLASARV